LGCSHENFMEKRLRSRIQLLKIFNHQFQSFLVVLGFYL
jgi:hypothetical protein